MPHIIDRLATLRVENVMAADVLTVSQNQTMGDVAQILARNSLSSAPVVDELGHCVGVVTASDFVARESKLQRLNDSSASDTSHIGRADDGPLRCISTGDDYVAYHMSSGVQAVDPEASLLKATRMMCDGHIHRLLVIDEQNHPVGVISTMDIMAAMVNVVDEMNGERGQCR